MNLARQTNDVIIRGHNAGRVALNRIRPIRSALEAVHGRQIADSALKARPVIPPDLKDDDGPVPANGFPPTGDDLFLDALNIDLDKSGE